MARSLKARWIYLKVKTTIWRFWGWNWQRIVRRDGKRATKETVTTTVKIKFKTTRSAKETFKIIFKLNHWGLRWWLYKQKIAYRGWRIWWWFWAAVIAIAQGSGLQASGTIKGSTKGSPKEESEGKLRGW